MQKSSIHVAVEAERKDYRPSKVAINAVDNLEMGSLGVGGKLSHLTHCKADVGTSESLGKKQAASCSRIGKTDLFRRIDGVVQLDVGVRRSRDGFATLEAKPVHDPVNVDSSVHVKDLSTGILMDVKADI